MRLKNSFGNCSKCGKQIMWIKTKAGKSMPWRLWQIKVERVLKLVRHWEL